MRDMRSTDFDFSTLSLADLIEARDTFHFHLMSKANVVGTAVGLYLIRNNEEWPKNPGEGANPPRKKTYPREFGNSQVRDYSWPCIIVLVREWVDEHAFGRKGMPSSVDMVPKRIYLPDGRIVPVCTVLAPPLPQGAPLPMTPVVWPQETLGGGLPLLVEVQKEQHVATIGCLVSDGHTTYALTARHACGEPGTEVLATLRDGTRRIGISSDRQITRRLFSEVYPALPLRQTWLGLDVGLVRLDDMRDWTSNVYGLPKMKPLFDVYEQNLSLRRLMDQPVVAVGGASGLLQGKLKAMFYRYRSVGGFDYVSDFLIAPVPRGKVPRHGDSGALWHLQMPGPDGKEDKRPMAERDLRPLAIEWGAQVLADGGERSTYSVATSLSNISKLLDVELVIEDADGVSGTWGAVGHYSIGSLAIDLVRDPQLKALLGANADLMSIPLDSLTREPKQRDLLESGFVPLADVPDIVWKKYPSPHRNRKGEDIGVVGGRDTMTVNRRSSGPEHPNHHCDADQPFRGHATLLDACIADPNLISAASWNEYFQTLGENNALRKGILPLRIWQYFERLKNYAATDPAKFLAAAGTLAHYVGDACQPLHGSSMSDGDESGQPDIPRDSPTRENADGSKKPAYRGEGVHGAFETEMISSAASRGLLFAEILKNLDTDHGLDLRTDGREAALAVVELMKEVAGILPPTEIIDAYERSFAPGSPSHNKALWADLGVRTGEVMALGVRTLAMIWDAAWTEGNGNAQPVRLDPDDLRTLYENPDFMRSVTVDEIEHEISNPIV